MWSARVLTMGYLPRVDRIANWLLKPAVSNPLRYGLALASVAAALGLALAFLRFHLPQPFTAFALSAIAIAFWYGGTGPGILSAVLASLVRTYFFEPEANVVSRLLYDLVFLVFALLMTQGTRARNELEARVAERTADLTGANEKLMLEIAERKRAEALLAGEKRHLEMVARGDPLAQILDSLCRLVEEQAGDFFASILLLDSNGKQLWHGGAPSLPKAYNEAISGIVIGPSVGSCGTAAYLGKQVIVCDIASDPLWADFRELALAHSLRACWSTPIFSAEGKVIGTFAMYYREPRTPSQRDQGIIAQITHVAGVAIQRKLAEDALRRSEAYLAETQRLSHTGSWAFNATSALYWSEENFRIWGFDPQKGLPDRASVLQRVHTEDRGRVFEYVQNAVRDGRDYALEFRIVLPDGAVRYIHGLGHPAFSASGELVEVVGTNVDVTERKRAEEALRQAQADIARVNRLTTMGELTASLAHEVNQPISAAGTDARTCLRWLTRDQPDLEEAREAASRVVKDTTRAAEIISRIRLLFKKDTSRRELVDINEIIQEMIVLLRGEASRYSISFHTDLAADLPQIMADGVQLQQVLMNLMMNGIDAMKDVDGARALSIHSRRSENEHLLVSVSDTGVGLPSQHSDQIFNAFFTTKPNGTGMGLSISRSIIEAHGGRLWASANGSRGAIFHLTLPIKVEEHA
jgi:PAS domain S-box-containing protein